MLVGIAEVIGLDVEIKVELLSCCHFSALPRAKK